MGVASRIFLSQLSLGVTVPCAASLPAEHLLLLSSRLSQQRYPCHPRFVDEEGKVCSPAGLGQWKSEPRCDYSFWAVPLATGNAFSWPSQEL